MPASVHQLTLLADQLKLSLLERQRAVSMNLEPEKYDADITRSLTSLQEGIQEVQSGQPYSDDAEESTELAQLRKQFSESYSQFYGTAPPSFESGESDRQPEEPHLQAAQSRPSQAQRSKSVRFHDNPSADDESNDPVAQANRAALWSDQERYRDEPAGPDQSGMDNQQIHAYHTQRLREQDEDLDTLGQSISRQRVLGIQMGEELDDQNALLDDVESGVDRHSGTLDRARKRLGNVARKSKDNWNWVTIGVLICIMVLLIILLN
ncbi:hypothetical protein KC343_g18335 [Hortaea werneckii]|uniref:t-SNARE coiled-coil homology domain-containing protein n=1 Tax=Hortaea werneckii TaxID=91943 RepID=A0A3M7H485_HORWE|nr:hypothetical protein KC338_g6008 [Hortaea werneckii]KAI7097935.1 hypothetical protein KC352_g38479 [Hortaea werneckii]KAI7354518.1 hypothetical protein KC320_g3425 [Hortaea werneckii]KAI7590699.1 hypothetical protein KC343_g18335 [Hortaea werneckii]KAI7642682.1 hypothetical protein KC322_g20082 [Hortaea werneckii]